MHEIEQDLIPQLTANRAAFTLMPLATADRDLLEWEQKDNYVGLMKARGIGGAPGRVQHVGGKRFLMQPGYYGEFKTLDEKDLTQRRAYGDATGQPIDITDLVRDSQDHLLDRRLRVIEYMIWKAATGTFSVAGPQGQILHTDTFTVETHSGSDWSTVATATPLVDFRAAQLLGRGTSNRFDRSATAYMNQVTANRLLANTNNADLYGRRTAGLATPNSLAAINEILLGENLPRLEIMDDGYLADNGDFTPYIADDKVIIKGTRVNGDPIGRFVMTRNLNNTGGAAGPYTQVIVKQGVPPIVEVHDGFNGGPTVEYPGGIILMSV